MWQDEGLPAGGRGYLQEHVMDGLSPMDKAEYVKRMQAECRRIMEQVADAVNAAPTGNVINGSEMQVRDLMEELRRKTFELAVQMRIDSHESTFSPSQGRGGQKAGEQGAVQPEHADGQRADRLVAPAVVGRAGRKRQSGRRLG
jgi:hypothetical protein